LFFQAPDERAEILKEHYKQFHGLPEPWTDDPVFQELSEKKLSDLKPRRSPKMRYRLERIIMKRLWRA
jgi:hypothetical protein